MRNPSERAAPLLRRERTTPPPPLRWTARQSARSGIRAAAVRAVQNRCSGRRWGARAVGRRRRQAGSHDAHRRRAYRNRRQLSARLASIAISVPASARDTGQLAFACSALDTNVSSSTPGTTPTVFSSIRVIVKPLSCCSRRTLAVVLQVRGRVTSLAERIGERHREAAGLRRPDQLFRIRRALDVLDSRTKRERSLERAAAEADPTPTIGYGPLPARLRLTSDPETHYALSPLVVLYLDQIIGACRAQAVTACDLVSTAASRRTLKGVAAAEC